MWTAQAHSEPVAATGFDPLVAIERQQQFLRAGAIRWRKCCHGKLKTLACNTLPESGLPGQSVDLPLDYQRLPHAVFRQPARERLARIPAAPGIGQQQAGKSA